MDQDSLNTPEPVGSEVRSAPVHRPWPKFLIGFLGWFLITLPVIRFTDFFFGAYVPANFVLLAVLLLLKRTRLVGVGMAGAIAVNFLVSIIIGTVLSPRDLAPVLHPDVFRSRWNFNFTYVSKDVTPELISGCVGEAASAKDPASGQPPGRLMFESWPGGSPAIYIMDADGSGQRRLSSQSGEDVPSILEYAAHPAWSPDGKQIAFSSRRGSNTDVYLMNADGSDVRRLTEDPALDWIPSWSPDGRQIAFNSNRDGNHEIYIVNVDGSAPTNLTRHPAQDLDPAWSPDGRQIAFTSDRDGSEAKFPENTGIYVINVDGTGVMRPTGSRMPGIRPAWSPNSKCLIYQSSVYLNDWIMLVEMNGSEPVKLVHAGSYPSWSPDGRWVAYAVPHGEWNLEIYTLNLETFQTSRLTYNDNLDANPVWAPNKSGP